MKKILNILLCASVSLGAWALPGEIEKIASLRETADSLHGIGRTDSAELVIEEAISLAEKIGDKTQIVGTHSSQGVFLRSLGRIDEALASYGKALEIVTSGRFRENPDQEAVEEIAALYINLATLNLDMQQKEKAANNAELSGEWAAKSNDAGFRSMVFGAAGSVLTGCGMYEKALHYQELAYKNATEAGNSDSAFRAAVYTMLAADRLGDKAKSAAWRRKCQEILPQIESTMSMLTYYQAECSISLKDNRPKEALEYFDKILGLEGIDNLPFVVFDCYNNMHIAYASLGDYRNAYQTLLKGNELRDTLWAREKAESLRELTVKYETKETELALARSEARSANRLMWLFAALGLLLVIVTGFVIYASRQRRRRLAREIEFANLRADIGRRLTQQYVEGLENERERMARELHDGVCNDLLAIRMNMSEGVPASETAALIDTCRESVRRISHELMPPEFAYANLDEVVRYYLMKQQETCGDGVRIIYSATAGDWTSVPDGVALEIYRIVQEAVGNSIKHSGATKIDVTMSVTDGSLTLEVADNGTYSPSGKRGIGLNSMRRRAAAVGGTLTVETDAENAMRVVLNVNIGK